MTELGRGLVLLHFEPRYEHAGHYLIYAKREPRRYALDVIARRRFAPNALVDAALDAGVDVQVAAVFPGWDRNDRRRMRRSGGLSRFCPTCRSSGAYHA